MKLKGPAQVWWRSIDVKNAVSRRPSITTWADMKTKLEGKYMPIDYIGTIFEQLVAFKQGNLLAEEYTEKLHELIVQCKLPKEDHQSIS